jgi:hypothetical protein
LNWILKSECLMPLMVQTMEGYRQTGRIAGIGKQQSQIFRPSHHIH